MTDFQSALAVQLSLDTDESRREEASTERGRRFADLRKQMAPHFGAWRVIQSMRDVRRTFRRAGSLFVREGGGWRARLWFGWKLNWHWMLVPTAPVVILAVSTQPAWLLGLLIWLAVRKRGA